MSSCGINWSFLVSCQSLWWLYTNSPTAFLILVGKCMSTLRKIRQWCWIFCNSIRQCLSFYVCAFHFVNLAAALIHSWSLNARGRLRMNTDSGMIPLSQLEVSSSQGRDNRGIVVTTDEKVNTVWHLLTLQVFYWHYLYKTRSFDNPTSPISFKKMVERRVNAVSDEVKHPPQGV